MLELKGLTCRRVCAKSNVMLRGYIEIQGNIYYVVYNDTRGLSCGFITVICCDRIGCCLHW